MAREKSRAFFVFLLGPGGGPAIGLQWRWHRAGGVYCSIKFICMIKITAGPCAADPEVI